MENIFKYEEQRILCILYKKIVFVCYIGRFTVKNEEYIIKTRYEIDLI